MSFMQNPNETQNHLFRLSQTLINELLRRFKKHRNMVEKLGQWDIAEQDSKFMLELEMNPNGWRIMHIDYHDPDALEALLKDKGLDYKVLDSDGTFIIRSENVPEINRIFSEHLKSEDTKYTITDNGELLSLDDLENGGKSPDEHGNDEPPQDGEYWSEEDTPSNGSAKTGAKPVNPFKDENVVDEEPAEESKGEETSGKNEGYNVFSEDEYDEFDYNDNTKKKTKNDEPYNIFSESDEEINQEDKETQEEISKEEPDTKIDGPSLYEDEEDDEWYNVSENSEELEEQSYGQEDKTEDVHNEDINDWEDTEEYSNPDLVEDQAPEMPEVQQDPYIVVSMQDDNGNTYTQYYLLERTDETVDNFEAQRQNDQHQDDGMDYSRLGVGDGSVFSFTEYHEKPIDQGMAVYVDQDNPANVAVNIDDASYEYIQKQFGDGMQGTPFTVNIDNNVVGALEPGAVYRIQAFSQEDQDRFNSINQNTPWLQPQYQTPINEPAGSSVGQVFTQTPSFIENTNSPFEAPATLQGPTFGSSFTSMTFSEPMRQSIASPVLSNNWQNNTQGDGHSPQGNSNGALGYDSQHSPSDSPSLQSSTGPAVISIERIQTDEGLQNHDAVRNAAIDATHIKDGYDESNLKKIADNRELGMLNGMVGSFGSIGENGYLIGKGNAIRQSLTNDDINFFNTIVNTDKYKKLDFSTEEGTIESIKSLSSFSIDNHIIGRKNAGVSAAYFANDKDTLMNTALLDGKTRKLFTKKTGKSTDVITLRESLITSLRAEYQSKVKAGIIKATADADKRIIALADHILISGTHIANASTGIGNFTRNAGSLSNSIIRLTKLDSEENMGMLKNTAHAMDTGMTAANALATARANVLEWRMQRLGKQIADYTGEQSAIAKSLAQGSEKYTSRYIKKINAKKAKAIAKSNKLSGRYAKAKKTADKISKAADRIKMPQRKLKKAGVKIVKQAAKSTAQVLSKTAAGKVVVAKVTAAAKAAAAVSSYVANLATGVSEVLTVIAVVVALVILALIAMATLVGLFIGLIMLFIGVVSMFFTGDDASSPTSQMYDENGVILFDKSPIGRVYKALEDNEVEWIKKLIDGIYDPDYPPMVDEIEEYLDLTGTIAGSGAGASGNYSMNWDNAKIVWNILKDNGFSDYAAAGVLGNLARESGCNPTAFRNSTDKGYGIAQWTDYKSTTNWTQMRQQMAAHGYAEDNLEGQVYCMIEEWVKLWYNGDNKKKGVKANNMQDYRAYSYSSVEDAVFDWCYGAEKPAESTAGMDVRNAAALKAYAMFSPNGAEYEDNGYVDNTETAEETSVNSSTNTGTALSGNTNSANKEGSTDSTSKVNEVLEEGELSLDEIAGGAGPGTGSGIMGKGVNLFKRKPLPIETFAPLVLGREYASDGVIGPQPFANAPAEAYKHIRIIDGGSELHFLDQEGKVGVSSNIKTITTMYHTANHALENNSDDYDEAVLEGAIEAADSGNVFEMAATLFTKAVEGVFKKISRGVKDIFNGIAETNRNSAAISYTHMLFNATHQVGFSLRIVSLPTAPRGGSYNGTLGTVTAMSTGTNYGIQDPFKGEAWPNLTDDEVRRLTIACLDEQGTYEGVLYEASLLANLTSQRSHGSDPRTVIQSSWFAKNTHKAYRNGRSVYGNHVTNEMIEAVSKILREGERITHANEHDCFSDIRKIEVNGRVLTSRSEIRNRNNYIPGKTIIYNASSSVYKFMTFANGTYGDPFGTTDLTFEYNFVDEPDTDTSGSNVLSGECESSTSGTANASSTAETSSEETSNASTNTSNASTQTSQQFVQFAGDGGENVCTGNESQSRPVSQHDEHEGHGCMSYDKFSFLDMNNPTKMFYDGTYVEQVYPAYLLDGGASCVPVLNRGFIEAYNENPDCWELVSVDNYEEEGWSSGQYREEYDGKVNACIDSEHGFSITGSGEERTVTVFGEHDGDPDDNDETTDITEYTFKHNCNGDHKGYYCGGHLKLLVIGTIMNVTKDEMDGKYEKYDGKVTESTPYLRGDVLNIDRTKARHADDIFDVDMAITHLNAAVSPEFEGWTQGNIEEVITGISDNWEILYGIKEPDYKSLMEQAKAQGSATPLTEEEIEKIMVDVREILTGDPDKIDRLNVIKTGAFYVGKISYNQANHGNKLKVGGINDCSGYASQLNEKALKGVIYNTASFYNTFKNQGRLHHFTDGGIKPGDILLHFEGAIADSSQDHALIYVGVIDGQIKSLDCTGSGTWYRSRSDNYYNECYYIDMTGMY